jgi:hypothetical protein
MNYERGLKLIYAVLVVCWIIFCVGGLIAVANSEATDREMGILAFSAIAVVVPILGFALLFRVVPWIIRGFKG